MYDYLIVGAGLYGAVFADRACKAGKRVLVIDKRDHIGGNVYTEMVGDIVVHKYGPHIFHTNSAAVWNYMSQFAKFNRFTNAPIARYGDEVYNLPFNMNTFHQMWGIRTPEEAAAIIEKQREAAPEEPRNLEEQAIRLVGTDIYQKLVKGYTEKQWGRSCKDLPAHIIKRLPVRYTYDNSYFNDCYQGIPIGGYTPVIEKMLSGTDVSLNADFFLDEEKYRSMARKIVYTGQVDRFFHYRFGHLRYRSLRFETKILPVSNFQGNAVVNYTDGSVKFTRSIEHKHFDYTESARTVVTREYPEEWTEGAEPYYPLEDKENLLTFKQYRGLMKEHPDVVFGGRLGCYCYLNMDQVVEMALCDSALEILKM